MSLCSLTVLSYKGVKFWGFLAYNLTTVRATVPRLCMLVDIIGPRVLHKTNLRKAA